MKRHFPSVMAANLTLMAILAIVGQGLGMATRAAADEPASQQEPSPSGTPQPPQEEGPVAEEIGSLRNARVAIAMPEEKRELTFFAGPMAAATKAELQQLAPNVRIITGLTPAAALARAEEAHGIDARYATPEFLARAKNLAWVQAMTAGVDRYITIDRLVKNDKIVLTNFRGVHGPTIADHAMAMLLTLTRDLQAYADQGPHRGTGRGTPNLRPTTLDGKTLLVVGVGGIGSEIGKRGDGFGMRVIGIRRSDSPSPEYFDRVGKPEELLAMLPEADVVAVAVPLTLETEGLFNDEAFAAMKPGSIVINIARGKVVETDALVRAIESEKLAGACLDVTDPEPLPDDHPLRQFANVIITPHVAGNSEFTRQRGAALLAENIRRFGAGEPLLNVVDKQIGY